MTRFDSRRGARGALSLALCALALASCGQQTEPPVAVTAQAQSIDQLAELCGLKCAAEGVLDGNGTISGVASIDAFFQSVVKFQNVAATVSGGIDAEIEAIRGDFGIAAGTSLDAGLQAQIDANIEGSLELDVEPARCAVDAKATVEAQAKCEGSVTPPSAMVKCEGSCEVEASAMVDCGASATLECTVNEPSVACSGTCKGSCEVELTAAASCDGTCKGSCSGTCEVMNASGECQGKCDGMCQGSCEAELAAGASCSGTCKGECTYTPPDANCEGGIRAECKAMAGAMVDCSGRCEGNFEPPMASAECQASAKADASLNVECTPPRVAVKYALKAGVDAMAQAKFEAALKSLVSVRLPALKAKLAKANLVVDAAGELSASADGALKAATDVALKGDVRAKFGAGCALGEAKNVGTALSDASGRLKASAEAAGKITTVLGV